MPRDLESYEQILTLCEQLIRSARRAGQEDALVPARLLARLNAALADQPRSSETMGS